MSKYCLVTILWDSKTDSLFIKTGSVQLFMFWIKVRAAELCCAGFICESVCGTRCVFLENAQGVVKILPAA